MKIAGSILFVIIIISLSCSQATKNTKYDESRELIPNPEGYKKDSFQAAFPDTTVYYILFGVYCGECGNHCATMYLYNMKDNVNTLFVDSTDSYFKKDGNIKFKTSVSIQKKLALAGSIVQQIPQELLTTKKITASFGCPDCTDGCGIYFEFKQGDKIKKFNIDYDTSQLNTGMKKFALYLEKTINQLGSHSSSN